MSQVLTSPQAHCSSQPVAQPAGDPAEFIAAFLDKYENQNITEDLWKLLLMGMGSKAADALTAEQRVAMLELCRDLCRLCRELRSL